MKGNLFRFCRFLTLENIAQTRGEIFFERVLIDESELKVLIHFSESER